MITSNSFMNPVYDQAEIDSVTSYMKSGGWIMEHTLTRELEALICDYTGAKYAAMVPSATMGLLLASMIVEIKPREKFAVSAFTQAATANGAIALGGCPVIVDVDETTGTIDFDKIPGYCRVIFVTSINGRYPLDIKDKITQLRDCGHFVIEDSAQALGSVVNKQHCGTFGDLGIFSFGAPKMITTGQGGCIITDDELLHKKIVSIKNFGRTVDFGETYNEMGLNFKFTDLQASFGIPQMKRLPEIVKQKKHIFETYRNNLQFVCNFIETDLENTAPTYVDIYVANNDRDPLMLHLRDNNIGCRSVYESLSSQPFHSQWATLTPNTDMLGKTGIQIPSQPNLSDDNINYISKIIHDFLC